MYINIFPTLFAPRLLPISPIIRIKLAPQNPDALIRALNQEAVQAQCDRYFADANHLAERASVLWGLAR
jgi:hypothetical protein